jgi:N-acetylglutamate synthase
MAASLRRLELAGLNALPAQRTVFIGGWVARLTGGGLRRVNSVTCLDPQDIADPSRGIGRVEALFRAARLPPVFRITPLTPPALEAALADRGWRAVDEQIVMQMDLTPPLRAPQDRFPSEPESAWFDVLAAEMAAPRLADARTCISLLALPSFFPLLRQGKTPSCCARVTLDGGLAGVFELATIPPARREGLARQILFESLEAAGARGARTAWLQVWAVNHAAIALYRSLGFTEAYRTRYRIPG